MATTAPTITWYKHTSVSHTAGTSISELSLGTVTAGAWGYFKVVSCVPASNDINNAKFWLYDTVAAFSGGGSVSLGNASRKWWFKAGVTTGLSSSLFSKTGASLGTTLACPYHATNNSVGAGLSLGTVTSGTHSNYIYISPQPATSAYNGTYTDFAFQLSYDFT